MDKEGRGGLARELMANHTRARLHGADSLRSSQKSSLLPAHSARLLRTADVKAITIIHPMAIGTTGIITSCLTMERHEVVPSRERLIPNENSRRDR